MGEIAATMPPACHPQVYLTAIAQKYNMPGAFYVDLWPVADPQLVVTDPDAAMQLLTVTPTLKHPEIGKYMDPVIGRNNIVAVNGEPWKTAHRMLGSGFSPSFVKPMLTMIADHVLVFHERLRLLAENGQSFSLEREMGKAVFDVIGTIVFGISLDAQGAGSPLLEDLIELVEYLNFLIVAWNPFTKLVKYLNIRTVRKRSSAVVEEAVLERYEIMKDEKQLPTRRQAKSIMDRMVADYIQTGHTKPPSGQYLESVVTK